MPERNLDVADPVISLRKQKRRPVRGAVSHVGGGSHFYRPVAPPPELQPSRPQFRFASLLDTRAPTGSPFSLRSFATHLNEITVQRGKNGSGTTSQLGKVLLIKYHVARKKRTRMTTSDPPGKSRLRRGTVTAVRVTCTRWFFSTFWYFLYRYALFYDFST